LSSAGLQTQNIAAAWVIFLDTHSGFALAMLTAATQGPALLLSAYAGTLLARITPRAMLLVTQSLALAVSTTLVVMTIGRQPAVAEILALSLALGLVNAFDQPARQLIVVDFVGRTRLNSAVGLYEVSLSLARTAGPAIGGLLLGLLGAYACFAFNALTYIGPLVVLMRYRPAYQSSVDPPVPQVRVRRAVGFSLRSGAIRSCLLFAVVCGALINTASYFPQFASDVLGIDSKGYGVLVACLGIGALPGALMAARIKGSKLGRRVAVAGAATASAVVFTGLAANPGLAYVGAILIGMTSIGLVAVANTLAQLSSPARLRGGIMGIWSMALPGMYPVTGLVAGLLADHFGPRSVFVVVACALVGLVLSCWRPLVSSRDAGAERTAS
jgi:MFS family permease